MGDKIAQLIIENIKTPAVQQVKVLSAAKGGNRDLEGRGCSLVISHFGVYKKKNGLQDENQPKRRMIEGIKEKVHPNSHIVS